jgi:toxin ParE1/3/4
LAAIWAYIAEETSETAATHFVAKLYALCERLLAFPLANAERPQLAPGLRVAFQSPYALYYVADAQSVTIIRVLHGARDLGAIADQGGFNP